MNSQTQCILKLNSLWTCKKNAAHTGDVLIVRGCVRDGPRIDCRNSVGYRLYLPLLTLRHNASLSHNIFNCVSVALYLSALSALFSLLILALFFRSLHATSCYHGPSLLLFPYLQYYSLFISLSICFCLLLLLFFFSPSALYHFMNIFSSLSINWFLLFCPSFFRPSTISIKIFPPLL